MSQIDTEGNILSEDTAGQDSNEGLKLVPVAESIRYRKRAQSAEKLNEALAEQLMEAKSEAARMTEQLSDIQTERRLMWKLAAAGAADLEAAMLIAKVRMEGKTQADMDGVIEQLKREKQYLFASSNAGSVTAKKTAGAKERMQSTQVLLERTAKKAATTGNRTDLQEYLKLRRNFVN